MNPATWRVYSLPAPIWGKGNTVLGKSLADAVPELVGQPFLQILDAVFTTGKEYEGKSEYARLIVDGIPGDYYFNYTYRPLFKDDGKIYSIMNMAVDVNDQVLAKKKVEEAKERTQLAVEAGELGTYELDLWTDTVVFSSRYEEIFDVHDTNERSRFASAIHPDDAPVREMAGIEAFKTDLLDYKFRVIRKSGNIHWVRAKGQVYFDEAKQPVRILGVVQNITEQTELERQKDNFLGIASHELKTPVTSIKGFAQIMERRLTAAGDTRNAILAAKMDKQATRLTSLIGDLLDVTKINHGRLQFNYSVFDFNDLVEEVVEDMQRMSVNHIIQKNYQPRKKSMVTGIVSVRWLSI